jgi:molybdenum cofactor cytidylyltransferase
MGTAKPLLDWKGKPLVEWLADVLIAGGASRTVVVVGPGETGSAVASLGLETTVNREPERGMLSSVHVGLIELGEGPFLVCPCDLPKLTAAQVRSVLGGWGGGDAEIVAPVRAGKRGHPTLFGSNYWRTALELDPEQVGLNELLKNYPVTEITVDDDGPFRDADTPDEWTRLLAQE